MAMRVFLNGDLVEVDKTTEPLLQIKRINCGFKIIGQDVTIYDLTDSTASRFDDASDIRNQANTLIGDLYDVVKYLSVFIYYGETAPDTSPLGGIVTDAKNIGTGTEVFKQKVGTELELRKINSTELDVTQNTNDITLSANSTLISGQSSVTAASGMEVLLNDSGTLKKADVLAFLGGGGGGKEPYFVDALIDNFINTSQGRTNATNVGMNGNNYNDRPISFVSDVTLKEVSMTQNNASANAIVGYFGLYELTSLTAIGGTYTFTKVYQEAQTFSLAGALAGTNQTITLTTPQTFEAGKVYMTVVIASQSLSGAQRPNIRGCFRSSLNKAVGYNSISAAGDPQIIRSLSTSQATMSGGTTMPATLDFATVTSTNSGIGGLLKMKVQNA